MYLYYTKHELILMSPILIQKHVDHSSLPPSLAYNPLPVRNLAPNICYPFT